MDLITRRRSLMCVNSAPPDNRIWLIKNGIEQTANTGGYLPSTIRIDGIGMSGWTAKKPALTQNEGFLQLSLSGSPVYGSLIPQYYFPYNSLNGKEMYIDCEINSPGANCRLNVVQYGSNGLNYTSNNAVLRVSTSDRTVRHYRMGPMKSDTPAAFTIALQISSRSTSYANIYNLWYE